MAQARLEEKVEGIRECVSTIKKTLDGIDTSMKALDKKIDSRPSWVTTTVITVLTSLAIGLTVFVLTG